MNRASGGGLVEYRCEAGESDRSDPEVDAEEDAWERRDRLRVTALVDKFRRYSTRSSSSTTRSSTRYSSLTVPSRWQSQSDRHAGLYSPDCNVTYNQPSSSHSRSPPTVRSSAVSSNDLDSLTAVYAQAQAQPDLRSGNPFQAFSDDRSWSTELELEVEDREVCSIVFGRHRWNHLPAVQSTHSNEELCGGDRHGDGGRYPDGEGDRPRYREFTDRLRNDDNYTDRSRLRVMLEDRLRHDDVFVDRSRRDDPFMDRSRCDDAFVDRSRRDDPFMDRSRCDDAFVDRSRGEDPFVDRLGLSAFVDRSRQDETYRSRQDDIFRDRPRYEDVYSDRLRQEEIFDDRPRKDTDRWMEAHTDRTRHSLSFSVNEEFVLPERKRRPSPSPDPASPGLSKRTRLSGPPVPSPPPPPVLTQPTFKPTDYSKPLPFKSSLFKPGNIDESINLLEKLKKKQKILSKCELKIGELYTKRNRLLSAPSSFYSLLQKPLKVQVNVSPVALAQNCALSFNGTILKNQSHESTAPSVKLHETLRDRLGPDRPPVDDDDCVIMEPVHHRLSDSPDRKSSPLAPPDKRQGSPDWRKAPVRTTASPERRKQRRLSPDRSRRSYASTNSPEITQTFKGDKDKASVNPILELAYGPRKNFNSVEKDYSELRAEYPYQDQKYPAAAWQEHANTGTGWPRLRRSPILQTVQPQPHSIPALLPSTSYQETPPSLVPQPQSPGALRGTPPERHTVRSAKSQITLNLLPRVDAYSAFPSVPEDKAYVAKVEEFLSKIQKPKRPEKEVVVTLSDDDDEVIYVGESKRRSRERPAPHRDSRRDRSPPHRASARRHRGRLHDHRSPNKSRSKTCRLSCSPLNPFKPAVLAGPPQSAAVPDLPPEVPHPPPTSPSPGTADKVQSDMSSFLQQRPPMESPCHKDQAPQKQQFTSNPGQTLLLVVGKNVSGKTCLGNKIISAMKRETDSLEQEAKSLTTNRLSDTTGVASDLSESTDTRTTLVIGEDSSTVTDPCQVNEVACEKETRPTECTSKDTTLLDKPENVICNTSVTLSDMDSIFCEGSAVATDVRDIQRRDTRLKKVVVNTQRNRTINKNLCLKNELLCLNIEKIGARIVVSSVEEQILNYLHCLASHANDKLPNIIKKYFTPIKELSKKMDSVQKACRHCSELSSKSESADSGPNRITSETLTDSQSEGTDSNQEGLRSNDKPRLATSQPESTNLTADLKPTSVGSASCTGSKLSNQEQHSTQAAQANNTPPEHQTNNLKSEFAESKQSHLKKHQKQHGSTLNSQRRPLLQETRSDKSVREKPLASTQLCKSGQDYDAVTLHSAVKLEAGPKCESSENSDSSADKQRLSGPRAATAAAKSSDNSDSSAAKTEDVRPKSSDYSDSSDAKTEAVRPKISENSDSSAAKTEYVRPKISENSDSSADKQRLSRPRAATAAAKSSENSDSSTAKTEDVSPKSSLNSDSSAAIRPKCRPPILAPEDRYVVAQVMSSHLPPRKEDNPINTVKQIQSSSDHIARIVSTIHQVDCKSTYYLKNNLLLKRLVVNGKSILKILIPEDRTDEIIDVVHTKFSCHGSAAAVMNILGKHFAPLPGLPQLVHNHIHRCTFCNSKQ